MKGFAGGLLASFICGAPLFAQERDRSLERISLALQQPVPLARNVDQTDGTKPHSVGIFTLVPPTLPGEIVRVSVPIGELVSRAFSGVAAANRRRQEAAARRKVAADLAWFEAQQASSRR